MLSLPGKECFAKENTPCSIDCKDSGARLLGSQPSSPDCNSQGTLDKARNLPGPRSPLGTKKNLRGPLPQLGRGRARIQICKG